MTILKKAIVSAAGAIASYYAIKYVTSLLEERPLRARVNDVKDRVVDMKEKASTKLADVKTEASVRAQKLSEKVGSLIREKTEE